MFNIKSNASGALAMALRFCIALVLCWAIETAPASILINSFRLAAPGGGGGDPGLVGQWKLNEGTGTTTADTSGNGNTGTLVNTPTWTTGPNSNGALSFALGSDEYVDLGDPAQLQITGAISITAWVNLNSNGTSFILVAKDGDTGGRAYTIDYCTECSNHFRFYLNGGAGGAGVTGSSSISSSTWYFLAGTFDPSTSGGTLKIYLNGTLDGTTTSAGTSIPTATAHVLIARRTYSGFEQPLDGKMDDVRIYNTVLDSTAIGVIYAAGAQ